MNILDIVRHASELYSAGGKASRIAGDRFVEDNIGSTLLDDWLSLANRDLKRPEKMVLAAALGLHPDSASESLTILAEMLTAARAEGEATTLTYRILTALRRLLARKAWSPHLLSAKTAVLHFATSGGDDTQIAARDVMKLIEQGEFAERLDKPSSTTTGTRPTSHRRSEDSSAVSSSTPRVFIGHGHSTVWRALKDYLNDRLRLDWDEFNKESVAGVSIQHRLEEMLDRADFAFLILTAEDGDPAGVYARQNVIHELGLFQGRLGFNRAIILLEEGCTEFSNIIGLGQIRFPKGDILARSDEIRQVLEREGILGTT